MIRMWATILTCDRCKKESDEQHGNWMLHAGLQLPDGLVWNELCPDCQSLSYRDLIGEHAHGDHR